MTDPKKHEDKTAFKVYRHNPEAPSPFDNHGREESPFDATEYVRRMSEYGARVNNKHQSSAVNLGRNSDLGVTTQSSVSDKNSLNSENYAELKKHPYSFLLPTIFGSGENYVADQERTITELRTEISQNQLKAAAEIQEQKKGYEQTIGSQNYTFETIL